MDKLAPIKLTQPLWQKRQKKKIRKKLHLFRDPYILFCPPMNLTTECD